MSRWCSNQLSYASIIRSGTISNHALSFNGFLVNVSAVF